MDNNQEIYCPICKDWFDFLGGVVLPPDVQAARSACGHNLPVTTEVRSKVIQITLN